MIDKKFFKIGANVVAKFREHTFEKALDINGKKFKGYSTRPSKWTSMNMKKSARGLIPKGGISYKDAKESGQMKRQATEFAGSTAPVLSSDLLRDWKLRKVTNNGFSFGTVEFGDRVKHLAKRGRVISKESKALPDKVEKFLMREADKYVKRKLGKTKGGTFNIGR